MGYVIEIGAYENEKIYFVHDVDERSAKEKAFEMFKLVTPLEVSIDVDENDGDVYETLDTLEKFEEYRLIDSCFYIEIVAKVDQIIG